jgi:hypothetical protein
VSFFLAIFAASARNASSTPIRVDSHASSWPSHL